MFFAELKSLSVSLRSTSPLHSPGGNSPKDWDRAVWLPAPGPFFFWAKMVRNDVLLEASFNQIQGQISRVRLSPILLKPKFRKFFHHRELGEGLFFQYLPINWTSIFFSMKIRPISPCALSAARTVIFFGCRFFVKNTLGFELAHMRQLCNNYTFTWPLMTRDIKLFSVSTKNFLWTLLRTIVRFYEK